MSEGNTENLAHENVEPPGSADDAEQNVVPGTVSRYRSRGPALRVCAKAVVDDGDAARRRSHVSPEYVASGLDLLGEYKQVYGLFGAADRVALQATAQAHGYVYEMRRATYTWFNRWFEMSDAGDDEASQAVEPDDVLYVTPTGFVTTSFGGETALSLTRQLAASIKTPSTLSASDVRARIKIGAGPSKSRASRRAVEPSAWAHPETGLSRRIFRAHERSRDSDSRLAAHAGSDRPHRHQPFSISVRARRGGRLPRKRSPSGSVRGPAAAWRRSTSEAVEISRSRTRSAGGSTFPTASRTKAT